MTTIGVIEVGDTLSREFEVLMLVPPNRDMCCSAGMSQPAAENTANKLYHMAYL